MTKNGSRGIIKFVGRLSSQAHLHAKATKGEAVKVTKFDNAAKLNVPERGHA